MACLKNILFFGLVVLFYLTSATAQEAEDAASTPASSQEVDSTELTPPEHEGEEEDDDDDDDDDDDYYDEELKKNPTKLDEDWVKNLIGVQIPDLSNNCFEVISKNCATFAGHNEKTLHCAHSYRNFEMC